MPNPKEEVNHKEDGNKEPANEEDSQQQNKEKEKKHDTGAADLEKVTDYAEEKEITSSSVSTDAIALIRKLSLSKYD